MLTLTTRVLPGVDYFTGFVDDPDEALRDVLEQVTTVQRRGFAYERVVFGFE